MEYLPGIISYFVGAYICCVTRVFAWKVASHWSKIWVADANQADSQILAMTFVLTFLAVFAMMILVWSIASYINYRFTEKGFIAIVFAGIAISLAVGQDDWLNEIAGKLTYVS